MKTDAEVDQVVQQAHRAYEAAHDVSPRTRAQWLVAIAEALESHADELVRLAQEETHLAEGRLLGELKRTTFQLCLLADEVRRGEILDATVDHADETWGMGPRPDLRRVNVPLGAVGVFGASNFPFAFSVMGGDTASALAAGCAVVHKIHEAHAQLGLRTAEIVTEALSTAEAPAHLFSTVATREAGEALVDHPVVRAVAFTGSARVGRLLMSRANARPEPIPFYGELGSINPVFVTRRAWQARGSDIITDYVGSFTLGMGQFCTKPGLLFVPAMDEQAREALADTVRQSTPTSMLTEQLAAGFLEARTSMATRRVVPLVGGGDGQAPAPALFTTTVDDVVDDPAIVADEMFGPASIVVQYTDDEDLLRAAELLEGQLTATVQGETGDDVGDLVTILQSRAGRVLWNGWPTGVSVTYAQHHGGPFPATTAPSTTSVGTAAVRRFMRPVSFQDFPDDLLPASLQEANPWNIARRVDGDWQQPTSTGEQQ